jgi:MoaA/NifB/PqqE/SkfB family radical SAM enzyme
MYLLGNTVEYLRILRIPAVSASKKSQVTKTDIKKPEFIILDITHRCNLQCNICEIRKDKSIKEFTAEEVKDLVSQSIQWGVKEFVLSGGEPFTRDDIFEILDFVKEKKYHVGILTNGILLDECFIKRLLPYLTSKTLSFSISLDSLTPEIHDDIRGSKGCFERTFNGLKTLSELKKGHSSINFNVISVILNENLGELLLLAKALKSLGANSVQFQPLLANNLIMKERSGKIKYWVPPERLVLLDEAIDILVEFKRQNLSFLRNSERNLLLVKKYFRDILTKDDISCSNAAKTMLIANNGDATTCFDWYGNVRSAPLKDIWASSSAQYARERVKRCARPCLLPCFVDE